MKNFLTSLLFAIVLICTSCNQQSDVRHDDHSDPEHEHGQHDHQHEESEHMNEAEAAEDQKLSLNNGERWQANAQTTAGIANMVLLVASFDKESDADSYQHLQGELMEEFDKIIEECTMTGEAHSQLHHYIFPMKSMFEGLTSEGPEKRLQSLEKLEKHLELYPQYFT